MANELSRVPESSQINGLVKGAIEFVEIQWNGRIGDQRLLFLLKVCLVRQYKAISHQRRFISQCLKMHRSYLKKRGPLSLDMWT